MTTIRPGERTTIEDVAREADVSYATVSRVINSKGYVSDETRERVLAAVERTGYIVNRQAQGLARGRSQVDDRHSRPQQVVAALDLLQLEHRSRTPTFLMRALYVGIGDMFGQPAGGTLGTASHDEAGGDRL